MKLMVEFITIFGYLVRGDYKYCKMISDMLCLNQKLAKANWMEQLKPAFIFNNWLAYANLRWDTPPFIRCVKESRFEYTNKCIKNEVKK